MVITFRLCYHTEDMSAHADSTTTTTPVALPKQLNPNALAFVMPTASAAAEHVPAELAAEHDPEGYAKEGAFTHDGYAKEEGEIDEIFAFQEADNQRRCSELDEEFKNREKEIHETGDPCDEHFGRKSIPSTTQENPWSGPKKWDEWKDTSPTHVTARETKEDVLRALVKDGILTFNAGDNVQAPGYVTKLAKQLVAEGYKFHDPQVQKRFDDAKFEDEPTAASCCKPTGATKPNSQKSRQFGKHSTNHKCPNWSKCMNCECKNLHPLPCKFGKYCRFGGECRFDHSGVNHEQ